MPAGQVAAPVELPTAPNINLENHPEARKVIQDLRELQRLIEGHVQLGIEGKENLKPLAVKVGTNCDQ